MIPDPAVTWLLDWLKECGETSLGHVPHGWMDAGTPRMCPGRAAVDVMTARVCERNRAALDALAGYDVVQRPTRGLDEESR